MKIIKHIKTALLQVSLITATLFGVSCNNTEKPADTRDVAEKQKEIQVDSLNKVSDAEFLVSAALINLEEIKLGQLAQHNGHLKEVKALGKMMEAAHIKCLTDLTSLAKQKAIAIPSSPTNEIEDAYQKLSKKTGVEFDNEYSNTMVTGHTAAIAAFEKAAKESVDTDIKQWATATLPELHIHLEHAAACQKKLDKM